MSCSPDESAGVVMHVPGTDQDWPKGGPVGLILCQLASKGEAGKAQGEELGLVQSDRLLPQFYILVVLCTTKLLGTLLDLFYDISSIAKCGRTRVYDSHRCPQRYEIYSNSNDHLCLMHKYHA